MVSSCESKRTKIEKDILLKPESIIREDMYKAIQYQIFCEEKDIEKAKFLIIDKMQEQINNRKKSIQDLENNFKLLKENFYGKE